MASNKQSSSTSKPGAADSTISGAVKSERLASLRLPRDLTLGGGSQQRTRINPATNKTYVPNLNVTRNKNLDVKVSKDTREQVRARGARGNRRGDRGRGGASTHVTNTPQQQEYGIFSYGTGGDGGVKKRAQGPGARYGPSDRTDVIHKPKYIKNDTKYDPNNEIELMKTILGDDEDDHEENVILPATDTDNLPILLTKNFKSINIDDHMEFKIKKETDLAGNVASSVPSEKFAKLGYKTTVGIDENLYPKNVDELFDSQNSQIFLMQLPDTLPGTGLNVKIKKEFGEPEEELADPSPEITLPQYCSSKSLNEGLIGKVVRYKSGKVQLVLGNTKFDMSLGLDAGFLQEVISINTNAEQRNGNMINLGQIKAKVNALPDFEHLFAESEKKAMNSASAVNDSLK